MLRDILEEHARSPNGGVQIENPTITGSWVSQKTEIGVSLRQK